MEVLDLDATMSFTRIWNKFAILSFATSPSLQIFFNFVFELLPPIIRASHFLLFKAALHLSISIGQEDPSSSDTSEFMSRTSSLLILVEVFMLIFSCLHLRVRFSYFADAAVALMVDSISITLNQDLGVATLPSSTTLPVPHLASPTTAMAILIPKFGVGETDAKSLHVRLDLLRIFRRRSCSSKEHAFLVQLLISCRRWKFIINIDLIKQERKKRGIKIVEDGEKTSLGSQICVGRERKRERERERERDEAILTYRDGLGRGMGPGRDVGVGNQICISTMFFKIQN
ncbi:hypothetical protein Ccrd_019984 [Cynara cardunculus var. scolymus]|uniref:Uncharacterized protein n=1 Tax=Cynara cardunculus var. scolymus TaxID=59895 RepID=A0A103Y3B3_CYNCS|nr:hypothetical protein Ccrd_019984 [Cynara cardunculus var. scolymus]